VSDFGRYIEADHSDEQAEQYQCGRCGSTDYEVYLIFGGARKARVQLKCSKCGIIEQEVAAT
jgi:ribosomal protein S27AE